MAGRKEDEGAGQKEVVTPGTLGKLAFDEIFRITHYLEELPEFPEKSGFFSRVPDGEKISRDFPMENSRYEVEYLLSTEDKLKRIKHVKLNVYKYDLGDPDVLPELSLMLRSQFQVLDLPNFIDGNARVVHKASLNLGHLPEGITVLKRMPDLFAKLFPPKKGK